MGKGGGKRTPARPAAQTVRILFAQQGRRGQVLLGLVPLAKRTRPTPKQSIELAERRLRDWADRGRALRAPGRRDANS